MKRTILGLCACVIWPVAHAQEARDFARAPEYRDPRISPRGDYVAVSVPIAEQVGLAIIRLSDMKVTVKTTFGSDHDVADYWWVGPGRLVAALGEDVGSALEPVPSGELIAINADGEVKKFLVGGDAGRRLGTTRMIDPLPSDPRHALIAFDRWSARNVGNTVVSQLDVYTGEQQEVLSSPIKGESRVLTDAIGAIRYVVGLNADRKLEAHYRSPNDAGWNAIDTSRLNVGDIVPLGMSAEGQIAYLSSDEGRKTHCLVQHQLDTQLRRVLACHPEVDLDTVHFAADGRTPIAVTFEPDRPELTLLGGAHPDRTLLEKLLQGFPEEALQAVSQSDDGRFVIYLASSDRNPGEYFLFNRQTRQARYLMSERSWIDARKMAERRPVRIVSRDGTVLHGYLTVPRGRDPSAMPLVVRVHDGPYGVRDRWAWDADAQFLASKGYGVLQVNFRGSAGYGRAFQERGRRGWGTAMIDDVIDATRWAIAQRYADPARVCIYGLGYGGYAALMAAVREPDLYKCTVGYAGFYDLAALRASASAGDRVQADYAGASDGDLRAQSPVHLVERLKAAVFIAHGGLDRRAPFSQATALTTAMDVRHVPYTWMAEAAEGHGFMREERRVEFYDRLAAFLDRYLGNAGAAKAPPATAPAASAGPGAKPQPQKPSQSPGPTLD